MSTWFWSRGLGPGPSYPGGGSNAANGLAGTSSRRKKNPATASIVSSAHPTSGSPSRARKRWATSAVYPARMSTHSSSEPSSAAHRVATLNSGGVRLDPLSATYCTVKSRVISARSMATTATTAPSSASSAYDRPSEIRSSLRERRAYARVAMPPSDAASPSTMPAWPSAACTSGGLPAQLGLVDPLLVVVPRLVRLVVLHHDAVAVEDVGVLGLVSLQHHRDAGAEQLRRVAGVPDRRGLAVV